MSKKNVVFQVQIKPERIGSKRSEGKKTFHYHKELYDFSSSRAKEYADKHDADYYCLRSDSWLGKKYTPAYHKLYIYELFEQGYDKIFYSDSDSIITKLCPNMFEFKEFSAMLDYGYHNTKAEEKMAIRHHEKLNLPKSHKYFCSGTVLFDKKFYTNTKDHWKKVLAFPQPQHDQSLFNMLVAKYYGKYNVLERDYGHWGIVGSAKYIQCVATKDGGKPFSKQKFMEREQRLLNREEEL